MTVRVLAGGGGTTDPTDADFNLVTSLYHFNGGNAEDNDVFTGLTYGGASQTWTRNGNVGQGSFSPFSTEEGKWGVYFDGGSTHNPVSVATSADVYAGTSDFTLEFFVFTTIRQQTLLDTRSGIDSSTGIVLYQNGSGALTWYVAGADRIAASASAMTAGAWNHVALSRASGTSRMWINGTHIGSFSDSFNYQNLGKYCIGAPVGYLGTYSFKGYISNFRFIKGTALYSGSSSITVPTSYLTAVTNTKVLCCQSNRYKDNSTVGSALTVTSPGTYNAIVPFSPFAPTAAYNASTMGGSATFVRGSDSLNASNANHAIGTSDFTIECWCYLTKGANSGGNGLFTQPSGYGGPAMGQWNNTGWQVYHANTETNVNDSGFRQYEWTHIAYVRASNVVNVYQNGIKITNNISDSTNYSNTTFHLGYYYASAYGWDGYISNFKMSLNAVYTGNFTPPTAPVTNTSGGSNANTTRILLDFTNGKMFDQSATDSAATIGGNVTLSTSVKKFGASSCNLFGGTGARFALPTRPETSSILATGKFTIEFWLYVTAYHAGYSDIVGVFDGVNSGWLMYQNGNNLEVYANGATVITGSRPSTGAWKHIALTRDGTSLKMFVEGTQHGSTSTANLGADRTDHGLVFGGDDTGRNGINGYIDEFRLTLGKARYTANFTAPTEEFPNL
ncbi:hypothetical protein CMK18_23700 [Candidatus Poribacteria bacterium]|nr:hypothetical protein [Candidatus Poribacteria bacterium]